MNVSIITTPLEPSDGATNVSTIIGTAENASTLTTTQDSVNHNQDISPVTRSSPTLLSRVLVDHTPKLKLLEIQQQKDLYQRLGCL